MGKRCQLDEICTRRHGLSWCVCLHDLEGIGSVGESQTGRVIDFQHPHLPKKAHDPRCCRNLAFHEGEIEDQAQDEQRCKKIIPVDAEKFPKNCFAILMNHCLLPILDFLVKSRSSMIGRCHTKMLKP